MNLWNVSNFYFAVKLYFKFQQNKLFLERSNKLQSPYNIEATRNSHQNVLQCFL
jgi:hypothetical protein